MEKPLVSVIIPTHNRASRLSKAVNSVLSQTFSNLEVIIVDDCSTDNTANKAQELIQQDQRVKYFKQEQNQGAPAARNRGIKAAQGKYIGLLDDDDQYLPEKIEQQVKVFENASDDVGLVYGGFKNIVLNSDREDRVKKPKERGDITKALLEKCFIGSPTVLIKKECFGKVGYFDEKLQSCQDWDMWFRIAQKFKADYAKEIVANYYFHDGEQITTNFDKKAQGVNRIYFKHQEYLREYPKIYLHRIKNLAKALAAAGQRGSALKWQAKVISKQPLMADNWKRLIKTLLTFNKYQKQVQKE